MNSRFAPAQVVRFQAFRADLSQPKFQKSNGQMLFRCRGAKQAFEQELPGFSTGKMVLKLFLETG